MILTKIYIKKNKVFRRNKITISIIIKIIKYKFKINK